MTRVTAACSPDDAAKLLGRGDEFPKRFQVGYRHGQLPD